MLDLKDVDCERVSALSWNRIVDKQAIAQRQIDARVIDAVMILEELDDVNYWVDVQAQKVVDGSITHPCLIRTHLEVLYSIACTSLTIITSLIGRAHDIRVVRLSRFRLIRFFRMRPHSAPEEVVSGSVSLLDAVNAQVRGVLILMQQSMIPKAECDCGVPNHANTTVKSGFFKGRTRT
jgi:hypothetical protein